MADVVPLPCDAIISRVTTEMESFYQANPQIKLSHGLSHALAVHGHAVRAIVCLEPPLSENEAIEIECAALLHDVDDHKYFPRSNENSSNSDASNTLALSESHPNATKICQAVDIPSASVERILKMISWVGCSENGNSIPDEVQSSNTYHLLIPRWSDRLEAVGAIGVVRCYRYNQEKGSPLCSISSPRAKSPEAVCRLATPDRFEQYLKSGGKSEDMVSHYYDKLLHIARPPPSIVRNQYLEDMAEEGAKELVEICVRFGRTGLVDEEYILGLEESLSLEGLQGDTIEALSNVSQLDCLPSHVLTAIIAKYCDTSSLSALLTALSACSSCRRACLKSFASAIKLRVDSLEESRKIPSTKGSARWNRQTIDIAVQMRKFFCDNEDDDGSNTEERNTPIAWDGFLHTFRRLSLILPTLYFFENERSKKRFDLHLSACGDDGHKMPEKFELPLWAGTLPVLIPVIVEGVNRQESTGAAAGPLPLSVFVSAPYSTWQPIQLSEWAKLNKIYGTGTSSSARRPVLRARPRRATPLPPLARITEQIVPGTYPRLLNTVSRFLYQSDQVIEVDVPGGSRILIMSRAQACNRLSESPIWKRFLRERQAIVQAETWSLAYAGRRWVRGELSMVIDDCFSGQLENEARFDPENDGELFAFMEPTDESNNEAGEVQMLEMTTNIRELLQSYKTCS